MAIEWGGIAYAQSVEIHALGFIDPNNPISRAQGVSADGLVVGGESSRGFPAEAFYWTKDSGLVGCNRVDTTLGGVSGDGKFLVGTSTPPEEPYRWNLSTGAFELLGDLPGGEHVTSAFATNWDGSVVAGWGSSDRSENYEAFRWDPRHGLVPLGGMEGGQLYSIALGVSADGNILVGHGYSYNGRAAFSWTKVDGFVELEKPEGWETPRALGISPDGHVIVGRANPGSSAKPLRWSDEEGLAVLPVLDDQRYRFSEAYASSALGQVIVGVSDLGSKDQAVAWTPGRGVVNLNSLLTDEFGLDLGNWRLGIAWAVSYDGKTIVGEGIHEGEFSTEAFVARIPCIDDCDQCSFTEHMEAACLPQTDGTTAVRARLSGAKPGATLTFVLDYWKRMKQRTVRPDGTAKAKFKRLDPVAPLGTYHITLKECDAPADAACN
ncbi:MAG: hypothetical protein IT449_13500 [Phycisphaerales bacterium]|nr:hypothetical protein [Phycisphaerales bacterium]